MDIAKQKRDENIAEYILYIWQLEDLLRALQFSPEAVFTALVAPRNADDRWKLAALEWYMDIANLLQKEGKIEGGHLDHTLHIIADINDLHLTLLQRPDEDGSSDATNEDIGINATDQNGGSDTNGEDAGNNATDQHDGSDTHGEDAGRGSDGGVRSKYRELFSRLAPELPRLRETLGRDDTSDVELMFRALYAAILYRIKAGTSGAAGVKDGANTSGSSSSTGSAADKTTARAAIADEVVALISPVVALLSDIYHKVECGEIDIYKE